MSRVASSKKASFVSLCLCGELVLLVVLSAAHDASTGALRGTVTDSTYAPVANVTVAIAATTDRTTSSSIPPAPSPEVFGDPNQDGNDSNDRLPGQGRNTFLGPD